MTSTPALLIDAGNSRIKWAWLSEAGLSAMHSVVHVAHDLTLAFGMISGNLKPARVIVSSVAGSAFADRLAAALHLHWQVQPEFIMPQAAGFGVINAYREPGKLGVDRWATLIAARQLCGGAACIVDCGTAITVDILAADGEHLGGLIMPGLTMMRRALTGGTKGIADLESTGRMDINPLARDTAEAVGSGTLYAAVAGIDRIRADLSAATQVCYITGGDAQRILPLLADDYDYQPDLVLQGLAVIARAFS